MEDTAGAFDVSCSSLFAAKECQLTWRKDQEAIKLPSQLAIKSPFGPWTLQLTFVMRGCVLCSLRRYCTREILSVMQLHQERV